MHRGEVLRFRVPKGVGHDQQGEFFGVVVQSDAMLPRSVILVAPTSSIARPASFRPEVSISGTTTRVLVEQLGAVDTQRLGAVWRGWQPTRCGPSTRLSPPSSASIDRPELRQCPSRTADADGVEGST